MVSDERVGHPPSVDALARTLKGSGLPDALLVDIARTAIAARSPESAAALAVETSRNLLRPVINATGVLLHTNLGRAPLGVTIEAGAWNLEMDMMSGQRGSRNAHLAKLLALTTGAQDALVTNNGAAAISLVLSSIASGRCVIVSRGELVEIGGGFRIPEIIAASGVRLVEVGTTNRTRLRDYQRALEENPDAAAILKVHTSNYKMIGFTESASVAELCGLGVPVIADIGSGLLDANTPWLQGHPPAWLADEPAVRQTIEQGASLVTFSGDKVLGGPQAGIIAGAREWVGACSQNPLARAFRPGVMTLLALQEVLLKYLSRDALSIPFWRMAMTELDELQTRAARVAEVTGAAVVECRSTIGGGSLPGVELVSAGVSLVGDHLAQLREAPTPVIARIDRGDTLCDLRTVDPARDDDLVSALSTVTTHR